MKAFFKDIFEYHHYYNQKLIDVLIENETILSEKSLPLFSHCLNAHQIWNSRILKTSAFEVHQLHQINNLKTIDNANNIITTKIIDTIDLNDKISYTNSKSQHFINSVGDVLFHIANHFTHHKAQLISDLRHHGIPPIVTDYIVYKR